MKCIALIVLVGLAAANAQYISTVRVMTPSWTPGVYPYAYNLPYAYRTLGLPIATAPLVAHPTVMTAPTALKIVAAPSTVRVVAPAPLVAHAPLPLMTAPVVPSIRYVVPQPIEVKSVAAPEPVVEKKSMEEAIMMLVEEPEMAETKEMKEE